MLGCNTGCQAGAICPIIPSLRSSDTSASAEQSEKHPRPGVTAAGVLFTWVFVTEDADTSPPAFILPGALAMQRSRELRFYRSDLMNRSHAPAVTASVPPPRFVVSRTRTTGTELATSTQPPPPEPEYVAFRQFSPSTRQASSPRRSGIP